MNDPLLPTNINDWVEFARSLGRTFVAGLIVFAGWFLRLVVKRHFDREDKAAAEIERRLARLEGRDHEDIDDDDSDRTDQRRQRHP